MACSSITVIEKPPEEEKKELPIELVLGAIALLGLVKKKR